MTCGAEKVKVTTDHQASTQYDVSSDYELANTNKTYHWLVCYNDGVKFKKQKHVQDCSNPGVCVICHRGGITASTTRHDSSSPYFSNAEKHWQKCSECGKVFNKSAHTATCTNTSKCSVCGAGKLKLDNGKHKYSK